MNARLETLLDALLEQDLSAAESEELARAIASDVALRREVRRQLVRWELWSQQVAPERSAAAFLRSVHTRIEAEGHADAFVAAVQRRMQAERETGLRPAPWRAWLQAWGGRAAVLGAAAAAVVAVGLGAWVLVAPHTARASLTLHGEAVCRACILHETRQHLPAIRVREGNRVIVYDVSSDPAALRRIGDFCLAPVPVVATGIAEPRDGRPVIDVKQAGPDSRVRPANEPTLVPF